jgi:hypothetical protein
MADWVAAISSSLSALAAIFSLLAFWYAMKMQREDSINDVRPELLLLEWSIEDRESSNIGPHTTIRAAKLKNVGRGPAFGISCMCVDAWEPKRELYGALMISPYVAAGSEETVEIAFTIPWNELPSESAAETVAHLLYADLGERRHSVKMHLAVPKTANHVFHGAKRLAPRLFMTRREATVIEHSNWRALRRMLNWRRIWQKNAVTAESGPEQPKM